MRADQYLLDYVSGRRLYGDDFAPQEIEEWYSDEEEGYADLIRDRANEYRYAYHELDRRLFAQLPGERVLLRALGVGSAYGHEFKPVVRRLCHITILEPSSLFVHPDLDGVPLSYVKPIADGRLPFDAECFDLITCFSVLHHIPNVSSVLRDLSRCLSRGGFLLIREPIVSMREPIRTMEDWRRPRPGLTRRERGIPLPFFRKAFDELGLTVLEERVCGFLATSRLGNLTGKSPYDSKFAILVDSLLSRLFQWNAPYHSYCKLNKLRPGMVLYALKKP